MEKTDSNHKLWDLLNLFNQWEEIAYLCDKTIGGGIQLMDTAAENVLERQYTSSFCSLILDSKTGYQKCTASYLEGCFGQEALKQDFSIFTCHAGLTIFSLPVIVHQKPAGAIISAGIFTDSIEEEKFKNYLQEIGVEAAKAMALLKEVRKIPKSEIVIFGRIIRVLVDSLKEDIVHHYSLLENAENMVNLMKKKGHLFKIDELSGLHNRTYMWTRLDEEISRAIRRNKPLSVIVINIDDFKRLVDIYGDDVGNSMIKEVAEILSNYTRKEDVLIRAGDDEFVIILGETTEDAASILAKRIQTEINNHPFCRQDNLNVFLTISCGIASFSKDISTAKDLVDNANQSLHEAKVKGGKEIVLFSKIHEGLELPRRCVITGIGIITPIGIGKENFWKATCEGKSGVSKISLFDTSALPVKIAGEVKDFDPAKYMSFKSVKRTDRTTQFAIAGTKMAIEDAKLDLSKENRDRIGVIIGAGMGGLGFGEEQHIKFLKEGARHVSPFLSVIIFGGACSSEVSLQFGLNGPSITVSTGCSAGSDAIGNAFGRIKNGEAEVMVAGGVESPIRPIILTSFEVMGALSSRNDEPEKASRPFDAKRDGFVLGEGAGIIILEELEHALNRGAHIYAELVGYASTGDAYHMTAPAPDGFQATRAVKLVLIQANLKPEDVDYINAHGSSTPLNDKTETLIIKNAFHEHAYKLKVSSTKSMIGHPIGAAGGIELISCILGIENGLIPPTINYEYPDPECDLDYVPNKPYKQDINVALSNSFGFGGKNSCIVIKKVA